MTPPTLGLDGVTSWRSSIPCLLEYARVKYEEKIHETIFVESNHVHLENKIRCNSPRGSRLDVFELPYYIDGQIKVTGELPILRHLARKHELDGKTLTEQARLDVLVTHVNKYSEECFKSEHNSGSTSYVETLDKRMSKLTKYLNSNKFAAGDYITYADFVLFKFLEYNFTLLEGSLRNYPILAQFYVRVASLDVMVNYLKSSK